MFYIFPMEELRARVSLLTPRLASCGTDSTGLLIALKDVLDLAQTL